MSGTFLTAIVLVEILGFRHTLWVAAAGNCAIALTSAGLGWHQRISGAVAQRGTELPAGPVVSPSSPGPQGRFIKGILFSTGFGAMAMEVVWTRAFTPVLHSQVYSYALIVFTYLGATVLGSLLYRRDLGRGSVYSTAGLLALLAIAAFVPNLANDSRLLIKVYKEASVILLLVGICPFCAILGYLTPRLVDEYAAGQPREAGKAYAVNVLGCILGPLFASYVLLPWLNERYALVILGLPFLVFAVSSGKSLTRSRRLCATGAAAAALIWSGFFAVDFEVLCARLEKNTEVRRDYAASVISYGSSRLDKNLLVNGIGMTSLTPITKFMVHLPLALHQGRPESALIICFGMGTTYRSALSWNIDVTAVELVPSVKDAFGFYHADAAQSLRNPKGRVIIDDGRRYLNRTREKFDVIVIDPPPPIEAAGSSLLYSTGFYELAKQHLKPHGIVAAWFPGGVEVFTAQAVLRSAEQSFPYVRCFDSAEGNGVHVLASMEPIEDRTGAELAARMPDEAKKDLIEWNPDWTAPDFMELVMLQETAIKDVLNPNLAIRITDDKPFNEYYLLRRYGLYVP
jgi:spermidine synthase